MQVNCSYRKQTSICLGREKRRERGEITKEQKKTWGSDVYVK